MTIEVEMGELEEVAAVEPAATQVDPDEFYAKKHIPGNLPDEQFLGLIYESDQRAVTSIALAARVLLPLDREDYGHDGEEACRHHCAYNTRVVPDAESGEERLLSGKIGSAAA